MTNFDEGVKIGVVKGVVEGHFLGRLGEQGKPNLFSGILRVVAPSSCSNGCRADGTAKGMGASAMKGGRLGAARGDVLRLFEGTSVAGLGDGELLDRFADRRDEAAFEGLVARLGPMVLGVCRRMLADPHDVDDAFQATFLVLVRRAASIRDRDLVGPWLHGVALRVARRARANSTRRAAVERLAVVPEAVAESESESGWPELRAMIDEEIDRLPEHHRWAVLLCDVEGLSREEAAERLGWTVNMVRGRLERARGRLRGQLARRGLTPSGSGVWATLVVAPPTPPTALLASTTVRAALAFSGGRMATGLASASAVALSRGVLRMMMVSKLKLGLAVLLSTGFVALGSGMLAAQGPGDGANPPPSKPVADAPAPEKFKPTTESLGPFQPRPAADLAKARIEVALQRYKAQKEFYNEGRITVDRVADASRFLMDAERDATWSKTERVAAVRAHHARLQEILKREVAELEVGRATIADLAEIKSVLLDAEFTVARELEAPEPKPAGADAQAPSLDRASLREALIGFQRSRRTLENSLDYASFRQIDDDRKAGKTEAEAKALHQGRVDKIHATLESDPRDIPKVLNDLFGPKPPAADAKAGSGSHSVADLERRVLEVERKLDRLLNLIDALRGPEKR